MWKRKFVNDRKAVSPVIAVILMVAITVVLAAVLYVMVGSLLDGPGQFEKGDAMVEGLTSTSATIDIITLSGSGKAIGEYKAILFTDDGVVLTMDPVRDGNVTQPSGSVKVVFMDLDANGRLSEVDEFKLSGLNPGLDYHFSLTRADGEIFKEDFQTLS